MSIVEVSKLRKEYGHLDFSLTAWDNIARLRMYDCSEDSPLVPHTVQWR